MRELQAVIAAAIDRAILTLPARALGVRSHALPTEDNLDACVEALADVVERRRLTATRVVVGSSSQPTVQLRGIEVLRCDEAAARATWIRNNGHPTSGQPLLLYFNSDSTPGEAGLDSLTELTPADLANALAVQENLPVLAELAASSSRRVREILLDASLRDLAEYLSLSRHHNEEYALPLLGFLPRRGTNTRTGPAAADAYEALRGPRAAEQLRLAVTALEAIQGEQRAVVSRSLIERYPELGARGDALEALRRFAQTAERHARGEELERTALCGLTAEVARALRRGSEGVLVLTNPPREEPPEPPGPGAEMVFHGRFTEAEFLERFSSVALGLPLRIVGVDDDEAEEPVASLATDEGDVTLRTQGRAPLLRMLHAAADLQFWDQGGALLIRPGASTQARSISRAAAALADLPVDLLPDVETFLATRRRLLMAASSLGGDTAAEVFLRRAAWVLEHLPLTFVAQLRDDVVEYTNAYERLLRVVFASDAVQSNAVTAWLTNLDLALVTSADPQQIAEAFLLPLHPLRLAHALLWVEHGVEPPPLPTALGVHYQRSDLLVPGGRDYAYTAVQATGPSDRALAHAADEGLRSAWAVLRPFGLVAALDVELVDVAAPAIVLDALCDAATRLLEGNADVQGLHLSVHLAKGGEREPAAIPAAEDCSADVQEALVAPRGTGVSMAVASAAQRAGTVPCHLAIQAIDAPYIRLPDLAGAAMLEQGDLLYRPGRSGNIALVEVRGYGPLEGYQALLGSLDLAGALRGLDPLNEGPEVGSAIVKALVSRHGWPLRPSEATTLLTHAERDDHVIVTLLEAEVYDKLVEPALAEASRAADLEPARLRRGVLAMASHRDFFRKALERRSLAHLRGELGELRAFDAAKADAADGPILVLELNSSEARAWTRAIASVYESDERRADLLIVEADASRSRVVRLRVAELKAGATRARLSPAALDGLAEQAVLVTARLRACFDAPTTPDERAAREALRRMLWMGAGAQLEALAWAPALSELDAALRRGAPPELATECWIVPEHEWSGEPRFQRSVPARSPSGEPSGRETTVLFRVLEPIPVAPEMPTPPEATRIVPASVEIALPAEPRTLVVDSSHSLTEHGAAPLPETTTGLRAVEPPRVVEPAHVRTASLDGLRIELGSLTTGQSAIWLPNRTDLVNHFNVGITGTMGTGKTQLTKAILAQMVWSGSDNVGGHPPGVLIFDYKGDYGDTPNEPFASAIGARVLAPEQLPLNPLHPSRPSTRQELALLPQIFADTLRAIDSRVGTVQRNQIIRAVKDCYQAAGIDDRRPETWTRPFPTVRDLYAHVEANDLVEGVPRSILQDLADLGVFADEDPPADLDQVFDGINVISLRPLGGTPTVIRAILSFFLNAFYDRMLQLGEAPVEERGNHRLRQLRRLVLVDEADDFMGLGLHSLKNVMQQGRSFGHGVILSTQFLHHFNKSDNPLRPLIGTWVLHQMADLRAPDVKALFSLGTREEVTNLVRRLGTLPQHTSLCQGLSGEGLRSRLLEVRDLPYMRLPRPSG